MNFINAALVVLATALTVRTLIAGVSWMEAIQANVDEVLVFAVVLMGLLAAYRLTRERR